MKKVAFILLLVPTFIFSAILDGRLEQVAYAEPGVRGGGSRGGSVVRGGSGVRGSYTGGGSYVGRGSYGGRGGYVSRGGHVGHGGFGHGHGGHFSTSIWIGPGWGLWDPFFYYPSYRYYPYPYYYAPPTVVVPQQPEQYIYQETQPAEPEPEAKRYWYYCKDAKGYYPYVKSCPGGWMRVVPSPLPPDEDQDLEDQEELK